MARYGYVCTNLACLHTFEVERPMAEKTTTVFCPVCQSFADRDANDFRRIRVVKVKASLPREAFVESKKAQEDTTHVHGDGCGCALKRDWHSYIKKRLKEDA
jgi:uncharacterized Zn finger protein (UPF0148 family)